MHFRTLIVSTLAAVVTSYGAASDSAAEISAEADQAAELRAQREELASRLDGLKSLVADEAAALNRGEVMQWHNWSDWRDGWSNY